MTEEGLAEDLAGGPPADSVAGPEAAKDAIQSIERAAQVLSLFDQDTTNLSVATVAERVGLNRTTAHRYLLSLQGSGFLSPSNGPGPLLEQLSAFISGRRRLLNLAPSVMRRLSDSTGMTVVLSLLGRTGPVVTHVEESAVGTIVLTVRVGTILELKSSQARVLLAFQADPSVVTRFLALLPADERLSEQAELARVRRDRIGWADLKHVGLAAVAAPVLGSRDIQGAVALLGTERMLPRSGGSSDLVAMLSEAAEGLSKLVGS